MLGMVANQVHNLLEYVVLEPTEENTVEFFKASGFNA